MNKIKKVGIMGGTFNPIHMGHLIMAETAYEQFSLDEVVFMPSNNPPHKKNISILDSHRTQMVKLAIEDNPHFSISLLELEREGITYTVDTLNQLTTENPQTKYYFIIGADSFFQIETWKAPETIFSMATILVASRNQLSQETMEEQVSYLTKTYHGKIELIDSPNIELSSNTIRSKVEAEKSIKYYVPNKVYQYILEQKLYMPTLLAEGMGVYGL